jgi:hypothetical protein
LDLHRTDTRQYRSFRSGSISYDRSSVILSEQIGVPVEVIGDFGFQGASGEPERFADS